MTSQEEKRSLVLNLVVLKMKIVRNLNIHLDLKNKDMAGGGKIDLSKICLVRLGRLELPLGYPTWPSTKLVYQFQHSRIMRQNK